MSKATLGDVLRFLHKTYPAHDARDRTDGELLPPDAKRLAKLITNLDSDVFTVRDEAMRELEKVGDAAAPMLRQAVIQNVTLELKRRLESLFKHYSTFQRLRTLRAVQALELLGTRQSQELLGRLADGVPEALVTREARAAMERLAKLGA